MNKEKNISLGLVHWPTVDRSGREVCTNVTNFDIHDIARACRTYGVQNYYIINRMREQLMFVERVVSHWKVGRGMELNPMRSTALGMVETAEDLDEVLRKMDGNPLVVATAARAIPEVPGVEFRDLQGLIEKDPERPVLLLFGTGFGLHEKLVKRCDYLLEPIRGASADDYRHLSVRSAVSICLDRLLGAW